MGHVVRAVPSGNARARKDEFRDKGFEIIGLNTDDGDTPEMVNDFAKEMSLNYTLVWASTEMQKELLKISKYEGIPQSFLIDRDGNLRGVFKGASVSEIQKMKATVTKVINGEDSGAVVVPDAPAESRRKENGKMITLALTRAREVRQAVS